ncbi:cob(I)yrinic acid a,c-diamide adenosyltransferase, partial [Anaerotignum sp.]
MRRGQICVYYGAGKGKTCVAVGRGLRAIGDDLRVVMIQFM